MANRFLSNIRINDAYTFPASDGTNNQVIKTDGSGNLSFGQLAADSASVMYKDTFTGDGSTTGFSLANALNDEVQSNIYIDGVYQSKSTYSVSGTTVTFSTAPSSGHEIEVISTTGINSGPTAIYTDTFTANGSATAFTLGQTVHDENQTIVFLNGVYQFKGTYTLSGTTLTLDTAPANGVAIEVMSIGSAYSGGDILYDHDFTSAGLMTTNGSGVYSITANNSANWNTAYGWGDHSTQSYATQSYVGTQISNLVDSSPATLNTLNELAAALGDDPNFATTTATSIGLKAPLASPSFTGVPSFSLNDGTFIKAVNATNNVASTNVWGYGLYEGASKLAEISLVRDGSNNQMYIGTTTANQTLRIGTGNKVAALTIDASQNATFAGTINSDNITVGKVDGNNSFISLTANTGNWTFTNVQANRNLEISDSDGTGTVMTIDTSGNTTFAGEIRTTNRLAIKETNFGYSASYKVIQVGESAAEKSISLGYDPSGNTSGSFSGNEILIPNNIRILAPAANNSGYYGLMMLNSSNKVLLGASNYLMESNYIMALDTATKNVGIGTDSPAEKLHIRDASTDANVYIKIANDSRDWFMGVEGSNSDILSFKTHDASNLLNITSGGNVGIGTSSPSTLLHLNKPTAGDAMLTIQSTSSGDPGITMITTNDRTGNIFYKDGSAASTQRKFTYDHAAQAFKMFAHNTTVADFYASETLAYFPTQNVGIGTTSPNDKLEVSGGNIRIYSVNNANHLIIKNNATGTSGTFEERIKFLGWNDSENAAITGIGNAYFGSPVNALAFSVSGVEAIRIKHGGQVRIGDGDSEQLAAIRLGGENAAGGRLYFEYNGDNSYIDSYGGHGSTQRYRDLTFAARNLIFTTGNTGGSEKMRISDAGDVSVNDTSANNCTLHINSYQKNAGNAARIGNMQICMEGNGSAYPNIGYGQRSTTSTTGFVYQQSDTASWFRFHAGGIQSYTAPSGTSGAAINFTTGPYVSQGGTSWTSGSDINLKENIKPLNKVLDKIKDYRCVEYSLKSDANKSKKIGFIAQDWEQDFAQVIEKDNEENLGIKYSETIPVLLKAIQELKADNDSLKARIETLENN